MRSVAKNRKYSGYEERGSCGSEGAIGGLIGELEQDIVIDPEIDTMDYYYGE